MILSIRDPESVLILPICICGRQRKDSQGVFGDFPILRRLLFFGGGPQGIRSPFGQRHAQGVFAGSAFGLLAFEAFGLTEALRAATLSILSIPDWSTWLRLGVATFQTGGWQHFRPARTYSHFADEEDALSLSVHPHLARHRETHSRMLITLDRMTVRSRVGRPAPKDDKDFFTMWLSAHILGVDKRHVPLMQAHGRGVVDDDIVLSRFPRIQ